MLGSNGCKEAAVPTTAKKELHAVQKTVKINSKKTTLNYQSFHAIASDDYGNIYALGKVANYKKSALLVKLDSQGKILWERTSNGTFTEMAVDSRGNVYVVGASWVKTNRNALIVKYNSSGKRVWKKIFSGSGDENFVNISVDRNTLYAIGKTSSSDGDIAKENKGGYDALIVKLNHNGKKIWMKTFGGRGNEELRGVSVDKEGDIYVVGKTHTYGTDVMYSSAALMLKYDSSGELLWNKTINATPKQSENLKDIRALKDGFYALGYLMKQDVVIWVDSKGTLIWKKSVNNSSDNTFKMITDNQNNIYVTGHNEKYRSMIVKFDSRGNKLWKRSIGNADSSDLFDVCIGTSNEVYAVGKEVYRRKLPPGAFCGVGEADVGALIVKLSAEGKVLWNYSIDTDK